MFISLMKERIASPWHGILAIFQNSAIGVFLMRQPRFFRWVSSCFWTRFVSALVLSFFGDNMECELRYKKTKKKPKFEPQPVPQPDPQKSPQSITLACSDVEQVAAKSVETDLVSETAESIIPARLVEVSKALREEDATLLVEAIAATLSSSSKLSLSEPSKNGEAEVQPKIQQVAEYVATYGSAKNKFSIWVDFMLDVAGHIYPKANRSWHDAYQADQLLRSARQEVDFVGGKEGDLPKLQQMFEEEDFPEHFWKLVDLVQEHEHVDDLVGLALADSRSAGKFINLIACRGFFDEDKNFTGRGYLVKGKDDLFLKLKEEQQQHPATRRDGKTAKDRARKLQKNIDRRSN